MTQEINRNNFGSTLTTLLATNGHQQQLPNEHIELIAQIITYIQLLKYPIDHYSQFWFRTKQPIFSYLDLSYYLKQSTLIGYQMGVIIVLVFINLYWVATIAIFIIGISDSWPWLATIRRLLMNLSGSLMFMTITNTILSMQNCEGQIQCIFSFNQILIIMSYICFLIYLILISYQQLLKFHFISLQNNKFTRTRQSSWSNVMLLWYIVINQIIWKWSSNFISLIINDILILVMITIFVMKQEHHHLKMQLIEFNLIIANFIAIVLTNILYFTPLKLHFSFYCITIILISIALQQCNTFSLKYELNNVNKWVTTKMRIKQTCNLRKLLRNIHHQRNIALVRGYILIHKQKCEELYCPLNITNNSQVLRNSSLYQDTQNIDQKPECIRQLQNLVISIYDEGCKQYSNNIELYLQYSIFLYELDRKQQSLKILLQINNKQLSLQKYYKYNYLKNKIQLQMQDKQNKTFLNLIDDLHMKSLEILIMKQFQQISLINLQFWSILNQDYPDFNKLDQIGNIRIKIGCRIKQNYEQICKYANNEQITNLYINYLSAIDNNQSIYPIIYEELKNKYNLNHKIILQDWSNNSSPIILIKYNNTNNNTYTYNNNNQNQNQNHHSNSYGTIINLNSTCAAIFGYEKYEIMNHNINLLFKPEQLEYQIQQFLSTNINNNSKNRVFYLCHKNGYLLQINRSTKNYNSIQTGLTSICNLELINNWYTCYLLFNNRNNNKLIGISSSCIALLALQCTIIQDQYQFNDIFKICKSEIQSIANQNDNSIELQKILKKNNSQIHYSKANIYLNYKKQNQNIFMIELTIKQQKIKIKKNRNTNIFQFHVEIPSINQFKFIGQNQINQSNEIENYYGFLKTISLESEQQKKQQFNYQSNISTFRMVNNIIQVIESQGQSQFLNIENNNGLKEQQESQQLYKLSNKQQINIFSNKIKFEQFLNSYYIEKNIRLIILLWLLILKICYISYYFIFINYSKNTIQYFNEIAYQNLIIGNLAKQLSLIITLQQIYLNNSNQDQYWFKQIYKQNLNSIKKNKNQLIQSYKLQIYIEKQKQEIFYLNQFLLTYINYMEDLWSEINQANSQEIKSLYVTFHQQKLQYLLLNSNTTRKTMSQHLQIRCNSIKSTISTDQMKEIVLLIIALLIQFLSIIMIICIINAINQQKINTLKIFLEITDVQIQTFSTKTERFLLSLHLDETKQELQIFQDQNNFDTKIINNNNNNNNNNLMIRKKKFKTINISYSIFIKIILLPIISSIYFILIFYFCFNNLSFMKQSIHYVKLTSSANTIFYSGLSTLQKNIIANEQFTLNLTQNYISYYTEYFHVHTQTFGQLSSFHNLWTDLFLGEVSKYIEQARHIPFLTKHGCLFILTDITIQTQNYNNSHENSIDFQSQYYLEHQILSQAHIILSNEIPISQYKMINNHISTLLNCLLISIFIMIGIVLLYGLPILTIFLKEINLNKNMLTLLPISIARKIPQVKKYVSKIILYQKKCIN